MVHLIFSDPLEVNINTPMVQMRNRCREVEELSLVHAILELGEEKEFELGLLDFESCLFSS